jgi:Ca2+/Na+ antiporter
VFAGLLLPLALLFKRHEIKKIEGFLLVFLYGVFIYTVFS